MGAEANAFEQKLLVDPQFIDEQSHMPALGVKAASSRPSWYLGDSEISGMGIFAAEDIADGQVIGVVGVPNGEDEYGVKIWKLSELARFCNHQWQANTIAREDDGRLLLVATRPIAKDDEIFANYNQVTQEVGAARMQYAGKDVPTTNLRGYFERRTDGETRVGDRAGNP